MNETRLDDVDDLAAWLKGDRGPEVVPTPVEQPAIPGPRAPRPDQSQGSSATGTTADSDPLLLLRNALIGPRSGSGGWVELNTYRPHA